MVDLAHDRTGSGEPLLLIHGTGSDRRVWEPIVASLAEDFDVIRVDLPGHGHSPMPPGTVSPVPAGYARVIESFLNRLELDQPHVVGHSVGGWTALELAKLGRARSVVALAPAGLWRRRSPLATDLRLLTSRRLGRRFERLTPAVLRRPRRRALFLCDQSARPRQVAPEPAIAAAAAFARNPAFERHFRATRGQRFRGGQDIVAPVTVAFGNKDRIAPRGKSRSPEELPPGTTWLELPECGHMVLWDDPELVLATIREAVVRSRPFAATPSPPAS